MMVPFGPLLGLMTAMAVKHFCADFLFQTTSIARGKAARRGWLIPLMLHALGHAAITLCIALAFFPRVWWTAPVEFIVHAGIDRGKVLAGDRINADMSMPAFWWLLGFDQLLHQLTNIGIVGVFATQLFVA